jgi:hypothetical protein
MDGERNMLVAAEWRDGEDGREAVLKYRWGVIEEDEDEGLLEGDEGTVTASVVGSPKYGNERVWFGFTADGLDSPVECRPLENVDPLDA